MHRSLKSKAAEPRKRLLRTVHKEDDSEHNSSQGDGVVICS
jgi:hypothetical protein